MYNTIRIKSIGKLISHYTLLFIIIISIISCHTSKKYSRNDHIQNKNSPSNEERKINTFINLWLGTPYLYGGNTQKGIDCSALVQLFYKEIYNINIPRTSLAQYNIAKKITIENATLGDLVFFAINSKQINHVGIYIAQHTFLHASTSKGVIRSQLTEPYYKKYFIGIGKINKVLQMKKY